MRRLRIPAFGIDVVQVRENGRWVTSEPATYWLPRSTSGPAWVRLTMLRATS